MTATIIVYPRVIKEKTTDPQNSLQPNIQNSKTNGQVDSAKIGDKCHDSRILYVY